MSPPATAAQVVERVAVMGVADTGTARQIAGLLSKSARVCRMVEAATLAEINEALRRDGPCVVLLDERILGGAPLDETLLRLTEFAPVALIAAPERCEEISRWVARGEVDFIPRSGKFEVLAAAIAIRRIRWAEQAASLAGVPWKELPPDFAAILRHEINNPLTGILGNAELLLAHYREKLPEAAAQRVETVVDLAVRLREATRRLSNAAEMEQRELRRTA